MNLRDPKTVKLLALGGAGLIAVLVLRGKSAAPITSPAALDPSAFPVTPDAIPSTSGSTVDDSTLSQIESDLANLTDILSSTIPTPTLVGDTAEPPYWTVPAGSTWGDPPPGGNLPGTPNLAAIAAIRGGRTRAVTGAAGQQAPAAPGNPSGNPTISRIARNVTSHLRVPRPGAATARPSRSVSTMTRTASGAHVAAPRSPFAAWRAPAAPGLTVHPPAGNLMGWLR